MNSRIVTARSLPTERVGAGQASGAAWRIAAGASQPMPEAPVEEPETEPSPAPAAPPPEPKPDLDPFNPDWPEQRPEPRPKA